MRTPIKGGIFWAASTLSAFFDEIRGSGFVDWPSPNSLTRNVQAYMTGTFVTRTLKAGDFLVGYRLHAAPFTGYVVI